jgi:hypothetical protein
MSHHEINDAQSGREASEAAAVRAALLGQVSALFAEDGIAEAIPEAAMSVICGPVVGPTAQYGVFAERVDETMVVQSHETVPPTYTVTFVLESGARQRAELTAASTGEVDAQDMTADIAMQGVIAATAFNKPMTHMFAAFMRSVVGAD